MSTVLTVALVVGVALLAIVGLGLLIALFSIARDARAEVEYEDEEVGEPEPLGPLRYVACRATPGDLVAIRAVGLDGTAALVLETRVGEESGKIVLTPTLARQFAAGMLDAADEADGLDPLLWTIGSTEATA